MEMTHCAWAVAGSRWQGHSASLGLLSGIKPGAGESSERLHEVGMPWQRQAVSGQSYSCTCPTLGVNSPTSGEWQVARADLGRSGQRTARHAAAVTKRNCVHSALNAQEWIHRKLSGCRISALHGGLLLGNLR